MHGESDPVGNACLTQQFCHVHLYRSFLDAQRGANLLIGVTGNQQMQYLTFALGENQRLFGARTAGHVGYPSMNLLNRCRDAHTEPLFTARIASLNSSADADSAIYPFAPADKARNAISSPVVVPVAMMRTVGLSAFNPAMISYIAGPVRAPMSTTS